jgi:hypothetical protein
MSGQICCAAFENMFCFGGAATMKDYIQICITVMKLIKKALSDPAFLELYKDMNRFKRNRLLPMSKVIMYLLFTSKASMFLNTARIRDELPKLKFPNVSKQAVSKARMGILPDCFLALSRICVESFYKKRKYLHKRWKGYHVFAIDGSRIEVPDTIENGLFFGVTPFGKDRKPHVMALLSSLYDVLEDIIVDGRLYPYGHSERMAAKDHIQRLKALSIKGKNLIVFDRGYTAAWLYEEISSNGFSFLVRCKTGSRAGRDKRTDFIEHLKVRYTGNTVPVRYIRLILNTGEEELLATNILDPSITIEDFKHLYFLRWGLESKYFEAKERMQLEEFNGYALRSVEQEIYINLLYMNLASIIKHAADEEIKVNSDPENKYEYQANRAFIIGRIKYLLPRLIINGHIRKRLMDLLSEAIKRRSQIQPDRKYERHKSPPRRKHFTNRKTAL